MRFWVSFLCLSLGAALSGAAPLAAAPFRSGEMRFSPAAVSRLAPRAEDFMDLLCAAEEIEPPPPPPISPDKNSARCCDKISNKPPCEVRTQSEFGIAAMQAVDDGTLRASLFARAFELKGPKPIETRCGRWTYSFRLDPRATQPLSAVTLRSGARAAGAGAFSGAFSGSLPIRARLEFVKAGGGRRLAVPVVLRLDLTGTWTVAGAARALAEYPINDRLVFSVAGARSVILPEGAEK
jgi:hypothetical protein